MAVCTNEGTLGCGTTWHAAGLIGQLRANETETKLSRYGIQLYADLEKETGQVQHWLLHAPTHPRTRIIPTLILSNTL